MKKNIADLKELIYNETQVVTSNKFSAVDGTPIKVRSMDSLCEEFEVNDIIRIPNDYQVLTLKKDGFDYLCITVDVESIDGSIRKIYFSPNCLIKCIIAIDDKGKRLGKVKTSGAVAEWYATQGTVDHAMDTLAGNEIIVMSKEYYTVRDSQTRENKTTAIYSYFWKSNTPRTTKDNIKNQILSMVDSLLNDRLHQETSKHLEEGYECIIRFKFTGDYGDETLFEQDYTINNIYVQLPLDFEKNMESWVSKIYKVRNYFGTIFFEYKLDFYNKVGERRLSLIDNCVNGSAFVNWD